MSEQLVFNLDRALEEKKKGIRRAAFDNEEFLAEARMWARKIAAEKGEVASDDVRRVCMTYPRHHNTWGAVFKSPEFEFTGRYRTSQIVASHGRILRIWTLKW